MHDGSSISVEFKGAQSMMEGRLKGHSILPRLASDKMNNL